MAACITGVTFVTCLSTAFGLQSRPSATTAWVAAPPIKYAPSPPKHAFVSPVGRGQCTQTRSRYARDRRNKCLLAGERRLGGGFDPLGFGWKAGDGYFMFNSVSSGADGLQQQESSTSKRGRNTSVSKTALNAIGVGVDDVGADPRGDGTVLGAGEGEQGGDLKAVAASSKTPEGWDYWGYRVLLLGVAAIWGTNFPVVSVRVVFGCRSLWLVGKRLSHAMYSCSCVCVCVNISSINSMCNKIQNTRY